MEALFLFLILILGIVLCSFLGGSQCYNSIEGYTNSYDSSYNHHYNHYYNKNNYNKNNYNKNNYNKNNYNHYNHHYDSEYQKGTYINNNNTKRYYDNYNHYSKRVSPLTNGQVFHGPNGGSIKVITNSDGSQSLQITTKNGETPVTYTNQKPSSTTTEGYTNYYGQNGTATVFYGPNGSRATVINGNNGQDAISVNTTSGTTVYTLDTSYYNPPGYNPPGTGYYNPPGYNPVGTGYNNPPGYNPPGTGYYNPPGYNPVGTGYYNPPGYNPPGTVGAYNPPGYNPPGTGTINPWASALPPGIPRSLIPSGQEDLYILKSEVVPPVCPACNNNATQKASCPPCQPCQRCELPPFECKKVPNYSAVSDEYQPVPVLNDFSSFGM